jgi:hypothetical protein
MKFKDFLIDAICCLGMAVAVLSLSFWLSGWCAAVETCPNNCDNGLVGKTAVKYVCPICAGVGKMDQFSHKPPFSRTGNNDASVDSFGDKFPAREIDHRKAVVRIVVAEGPSTSRGSGVLIEYDGKPFVLTAWHVVRTNSSRNIPTVYFQDGTQSKARVIKTDDAFDLALLECEKVASVAAKLAGEPTRDEVLTVAGYGPHPSKWRESSGRIVGRARPSREHAMDHIIISTPARQGDSGGPVFNAQGHVAGILWGSEGSRTYATHSGRIQAWLRDESSELATKDRGFVTDSPKKLDRSACPDGRCRK